MFFHHPPPPFVVSLFPPKKKTSWVHIFDRLLKVGQWALRSLDPLPGGDSSDDCRPGDTVPPVGCQPKNKGKTPKMDGENKGSKPYEQMDDLGGKTPYSWKHPVGNDQSPFQRTKNPMTNLYKGNTGKAPFAGPCLTNATICSKMFVTANWFDVVFFTLKNQRFLVKKKLPPRKINMSPEKRCWEYDSFPFERSLF